MKVLIVDDDQALVLMLQRTLTRAGYTTCHSYTGDGALELLRTETDIEVILLDVDLGRGIDGIEVARRMPVASTSSSSPASTPSTYAPVPTRPFAPSRGPRSRSVRATTS